NVRGGKRLVDDEQIKKWLSAFASLMNHFSGEAKFTVLEVEVNPLAVSGGRLVALDGVLRFAPSELVKRVPPTSRGVWSLLKPQSVAVAGVSEKKMNMGRIILNNIIAAGFPREKLAVLKNYSGDIDGAKCYPSAKDFKETVDMFVVAVPSSEAPSVVKDAAQSGKVRGVVLISGGMGEKTGTENVKDDVLKAISEGKKKNADFTLSGGNSLGIVSNPSKVNTLFIPTEKLTPPLGENPNMAKTAFISQSGAFLITVAGKMPFFKPEYCVSVGNQMDATVVDYVSEVAGDPQIRVILAYLEGLKEGDGIRLCSAVKKAVSLGKIVIVYKAGRTLIGQKAVMGHTASIAGDFVVAREVLSECGALVAETFDEFNDLTQMACSYADIKPKNGRTFIISNAGFEAAGMADNITSDGAVSVPSPDEKLNAQIENTLKEFKLDGIVDAKNPIDVTPMASDSAIEKISECALSSGNYDWLVVSPVPLTPVMKTLPSEGLENSLPARLGALGKKYKKPIIFCVAAGDLYAPYRALAQKEGMAVFRSSDRALRALAKFIE
ncbi:MAG: CoA-binding protein, partial [Elusimicrobia bacterium]|nr:CoA-binding protein [Elusimicrobiota bacterium]